MAVNLSPIWGAGAQLLDNSGNVLSGGKIYTYAAGTTTPAETYTSFNGITANSNPIILNSAGRVPYEIWLTDGISYKFVLKDSNDTLIATYDNLTGINSNFIAYTSQQEIQTATAGQTVFNLVDMEYQPGTHNLAVYVDGVNQYGPGAQYAYVETDSDTVTFVSGLHVGASVKFTTATPVASGATDAFNVSYTPPFTDSVGTNVGDKLAQTVSVTDFGAVGDGVTDDAVAIKNAITAVNDLGGGVVHFPAGTYLVGDTASTPSAVYVLANVYLQGSGVDATTIKLADSANLTVVGFEFDTDGQMISDLTIDGNRANQASTSEIHGLRFHGNGNAYAGRLKIKECRHYGMGIGYTVSTQIPLHDTIIEDIEVFNIGHDATGDAFDGKRSERCTIRRIYAHDIIANGLDIRGNGTVIQDVYVENVGGVGFSQRMSAYESPSGDFRSSRLLYAENITCVNCGTHGFWMSAVAGDVAWFTDEWYGRAFLVNAYAKDCGGRGFYLGGDRIYGSLVNCMSEGAGIHGFDLNVDNNVNVHYKLSNCTAKDSVQRGFNSAQTAAEGFVFNSCEAIDNGTEGFYIVTDKTIMTGCKSVTSVSPYRSFYLVGNSCVLTGFSSSAVTGATNVRVSGDYNIISNGAASGAGSGLITASTADQTVFANISLEGVSGTKMTDSGSSTKMNNLLGYVTRNTGTDSVLSGTTYIDVAHGLAASPNAANIFVTPQANFGAASTFWVSNVGATTFRINLNTNPGTNVSFSWSASIKQN